MDMNIRLLYISSLVILLLFMGYSSYKGRLLKGDLLLNCTLSTPVELNKFGKGTRYITFRVEEYSDVIFDISGVNLNVIDFAFFNLTKGSNLEILVNKNEFYNKKVNRLFYLRNGNNVYLKEGDVQIASKNNLFLGLGFVIIILIYQVYLLCKKR